MTPSSKLFQSREYLTIPMTTIMAVISAIRAVHSQFANRPITPQLRRNLGAEISDDIRCNLSSVDIPRMDVVVECNAQNPSAVVISLGEATMSDPTPRDRLIALVRGAVYQPLNIDARLRLRDSRVSDPCDWDELTGREYTKLIDVLDSLYVIQERHARLRTQSCELMAAIEAAVKESEGPCT